MQVMSELKPGLVPDYETPRWWESQWYRITPRSFKHYELLFEPDRLYMVFAGESYKSLLLRQDGRERRATEIGREHARDEKSELLDDDHNETISLSTVREIRVRDGTLFRKPRLGIETTEESLEFYHFSRRYDVSDLVAWACETYGEDVVRNV